MSLLLDQNQHCITLLYIGFPSGTSGKESACQCRRCKRSWFDPWVGKIPWRRAWQPTPVFLPGKSHGQRSLAGCSPQGHKELDMTEHALTIYYIRWPAFPIPWKVRLSFPENSPAIRGQNCIECWLSNRNLLTPIFIKGLLNHPVENNNC